MGHNLKTMVVLNVIVFIQWDVCKVTQNCPCTPSEYKSCCIQGIKPFYGILYLLELFDPQESPQEPQNVNLKQRVIWIN